VKLSAPEQAKRINLIESHLPKKRKVYFSPKMVSNIQLKGSLNFFDLPPCCQHMQKHGHSVTSAEVAG
jgi:hypothetical protein